MAHRSGRSFLAEDSNCAQKKSIAYKPVEEAGQEAASLSGTVPKMQPDQQPLPSATTRDGAVQDSARRGNESRKGRKGHDTIAVQATVHMHLLQSVLLAGRVEGSTWQEIKLP